MTERAHVILYFVKIYFLTNCYALMMNIGQIMTKKANHYNMQMSFWRKFAKPH